MRKKGGGTSIHRDLMPRLSSRSPNCKCFARCVQTIEIVFTGYTNTHSHTYIFHLLNSTFIIAISVSLYVYVCVPISSPFFTICCLVSTHRQVLSISINFAALQNPSHQDPLKFSRQGADGRSLFCTHKPQNSIFAQNNKHLLLNFNAEVCEIIMSKAHYLFEFGWRFICSSLFSARLVLFTTSRLLCSLIQFWKWKQFSSQQISMLINKL